MASSPEVAWGQLSPSSAAAFEFAAGCFMPPPKAERSKAARPPQVTSRALLVGILESHSGSDLDDPAGELLEQFRIVRKRLNEELQQVWAEQESRFDPTIRRRVSLTAFPPLSDNVSRALELASRLWRTIGPGQPGIPLRYLFGGLLQVPNSGAYRSLEALIGRVELATVVSAYPSYLGRGPEVRLADFLKDPAGETDVGHEAPSGEPPDEPTGESPIRPRLYSVGTAADDVGGPADVLGRAALAEHISHWLAAWNLQTPLAVGLFGVWGSGKSFFMRQMQTRIRELTERSAKAAHAGHSSAFCTNIAQVEFNAWYHSGGELWPSLAAQVFRSVGGIDPEATAGAEATRRRDHWAKADPEYARLQKEALDAGTAERAAMEEAERLASEIPELREDAWKKAAAFGGAAEQAIAAGDQVADALHGIRRLVAGWGKLGSKTRILIASGLVGGLALLILSIFWEGPINSIVGTISVIGSVAGLVTTTLSRTQDVIKADQDVQTKERQRESAHDRALEARQLRIEKEAELERRATGPLVSLYASVQAERWTQEEQRGVVSEIRRAFEGLSSLMDESRTTTSQEGFDTPVDRVIVYIDDLDRCDADVVVHVLETIKLLMDLPNFVVIVGVDSRWLSRAIETHFSRMLDTNRDADDRGRLAEWTSMPQDYLEKIFQFSLVLPRMSPEGYADLVGALLEPPPARPPRPVRSPTPASDGAGVTNEAAALGDSELTQPAGAPVPPSNAEPEHAAEQPADVDLEPSDLVISREEKELMKALGSFIETPRSAKRLTNVYRLFRVIEGEDRLLRSNGFEPVLLLLALLIGFPRQGGDLLRAINGRQGIEQWAFFAQRLRPERRDPQGPFENVAVTELSPHEAAEWARMADALQSVTAHLSGAGTLGHFQTWVPSVACYTFHPWQEMPNHLA